jgi:hypothetical protein
MAAACGITLVKKFTYRGDATEEYSNQYWFTGGAPADGTAWATLIAALVVQEKTLYNLNVKYIRGYGYDSDVDNADSVYVDDKTLAPVDGTFNEAGTVVCPGDSANWIRWFSGRTSNGKKIYLRKYFHPAYASASAVDQTAATWKTAAQTFATKLQDGTFSGSRKLTARGHSDTPTLGAPSTYVTTRTLKRRGKRPS